MLSIISRGNLTVNALGSNYCSGCGVTAGIANFENAGTINATVNPDAYGGAAICGGNTVTNSGTIRFTGADGGTVAGNVYLSSGNDVFVQNTATTGVSGLIDGGRGLCIDRLLTGWRTVEQPFPIVSLSFRSVTFLHVFCEISISPLGVLDVNK